MYSILFLVLFYKFSFLHKPHALRFIQKEPWSMVRGFAGIAAKHVPAGFAGVLCWNTIRASTEKNHLKAKLCVKFNTVFILNNE